MPRRWSDPNADASTIRVRHQLVLAQGPASNLGTRFKVNSISLTIGKRDRHPGLTRASTSITSTPPAPMLYSNSNSAEASAGVGHECNRSSLVSRGSKNIFVYPFSLNPRAQPVRRQLLKGVARYSSAHGRQDDRSAQSRIGICGGRSSDSVSTCRAALQLAADQDKRALLNRKI